MKLNRQPIFALVLALLVCAVSSAYASPADNGLPASVVPTGYGVDIHFTDAPDAEFAKLGQLGFGLVRMDMRWENVEKQRGVYDFGAYDRLTDKLVKIGARPLYILCYGNSLYNKGLSPSSPEAQGAFAKFAAAAAGRFAGRGVIWEIWNEPNLAQFWKPAPDPDSYARLAISTAKAIHQADPSAIVVAPATSGQMPIAFLERVFRSGLLDYVQGVSVHPYRSGNPETAAPVYDMLRGLIARYTSPGRVPLPILCSEWGYSTFDKGIPEALQAQYAVREYLTGLAAGVSTCIYYDWKEDGPDPGENEHHYGLVRPDLTAKPAFDSIVAFNSALNGYEFLHRLADSNPDKWVLLFAKGDNLALVSWSASSMADNGDETPRIRFIGTGDGDRGALERIAAIDYSSAALVATPGQPAVYRITVSNKSTKSVTLTLTIGDKKYAGRVSPGKSWDISDRCAFDAAHPRSETGLPVRVTWDGVAVTGLPDIRVRQDSPITASLAPRPDDLSVRIVSSQLTPFLGSATIDARGQNYVQPVTVACGGESLISFPGPAKFPAIVSIAAVDGTTFARIGPYTITPMMGFPQSVGDPESIQSVAHPNNVPQRAVPAPVVTADVGGPTSAAVQFDYTLGPGWRFESVQPTGTATDAPRGASAMVVWVNGNNSGLSLRARYTDETGQTFQPIMGNIDWSGWRNVTIDLTGVGIDHWGGANDGVAHGKLTITALLLVDTGRRAAESPGCFQFAYPSFLIPSKE